MMYSNEDLEIKCIPNGMKLASFVEVQPLLSKDLFPKELYKNMIHNLFHVEEE